eukprot:3629754-Prymnesium_polylepis.2
MHRLPRPRQVVAVVLTRQRLVAIMIDPQPALDGRPSRARRDPASRRVGEQRRRPPSRRGEAGEASEALTQRGGVCWLVKGHGARADCTAAAVALALLGHVAVGRERREQRGDQPRVRKALLGGGRVLPTVRRRRGSMGRSRQEGGDACRVCPRLVELPTTLRGAAVVVLPRGEATAVALARGRVPHRVHVRDEARRDGREPQRPLG